MKKEKITVKKHFVIFYSPGTFVNKETTVPIESWNVEAAVKMSKTIQERHGATPFGFRFIAKGRDENDLDSKIIKRSCFYYLGGTIKMPDEVKVENDPKNRVLISNMESGGYDRIVVNNNSWKHTSPLDKTDIVLEY